MGIFYSRYGAEYDDIIDLSNGGISSASIQFYGLEGEIKNFSLGLYLYHSSASDLDMLLVGPDGVNNIEFWSDVGGNNPVNGSFYIADLLGGTPLPENSGIIVSDNGFGSYAPTDYGEVETDVTFGTSTGGINHAGPNGQATISDAFVGLDGNGSWMVYIADDTAGNESPYDFLNSLELTVYTNSDRVSIVGTTDDDQVAVLSMGLNRGFYQLNSESVIQFADISTISIDGGSGTDHITGSSGNEIITGGTGRDFMFGNGGDDQFVINGGFFAYGDDATGEIYDGGAGNDTIIFNGDQSFIDLRDDTIRSIENLVIHTDSQGVPTSLSVQILASQIAVEGFSPYGTIIGNTDYFVSDSVEIYMKQAPSLDLSSLLVLDFNQYDDHIIINGSDIAQSIIGTDVKDIINGGGGADYMAGGYGNDQYYVDNVNDVVFEAEYGGNDTVFTTASYALEAGSEVETLSSAVRVSATALNLTGNEFSQTLVGNAGVNVIDGRGGADLMQGGAGHDIYVRDNVGDVIDESVADSNGFDSVRSELTVNLGDHAHYLGAIEAVTLTGTANVNAIGNLLANVLTGNAGNNQLNGMTGADQMRGLGGNDVYVRDNAGDIIDESLAGSGGFDSVRSALTINLTDTVHFKGAIEAATLTGSTNVNAIGNALANVLTGNAGNNTLNGLGGADTMRGMVGNDVYVRDNAGDVVDESLAGSSGFDSVRSTLTINLTDTVHFKGAIEAATLTGTTNVNAIGNALANVLTGNAGNNVLNGLAGADTINGGLGNDLLVGGAGRDTFVFNTALNAATNVDQINDFSVAEDTIRLDNAVFTALTTTGVLAASAFHAGTVATTADQHILYDSADGRLSYDADGDGAASAIYFATLSTHPAISSADFFVV